MGNGKSISSWYFGALNSNFGFISLLWSYYLRLRRKFWLKNPFWNHGAVGSRMWGVSLFSSCLVVGFLYCSTGWSFTGRGKFPVMLMHVDTFSAVRDTMVCPMWVSLHMNFNLGWPLSCDVVSNKVFILIVKMPEMKCKKTIQRPLPYLTHWVNLKKNNKSSNNPLNFTVLTK